MSYTEEQFASQVESLLKMYGWRYCHFRPARTERGWRTAITGDKGFPDYIAVKPPRIIFAELKGDKGKLTKEQRDWLVDLEMCLVSPAKSFIDNTGITITYPNVEVYLWRPSQIEEIQKILQGEG